jgi:uncharacterized protein YerC
MAATESTQTCSQTCVIFMKDMCYVNEIEGRILPIQNPHNYTLKLVLF